MTRVTDLWTTAGEPPAPDTGTITLQPAAAAANLTGDPRSITLAPITCELDAAGRTELDVIDSYDPGWAIAELPMPYRVIQQLGSGVRVWTAILTGDETHLRDLQPLPGPFNVLPVPLPGHDGHSPVITILPTITGEPGTPADAVDHNPGPDVDLEFVVPSGHDGHSPVVTILPPITGAPGEPGDAVDTNPGPDVDLLLTIPEGMPGAAGPAIDGLLTAKGDLAAHDGTAAVRVPVGADKTVLTADAASPAGVKWADAGWPQVALWADLPVWSSVPLGSKIHVTAGLGLCVAVRGPMGWVVAPESDTQAVAVAVPPATLAAWPGTTAEIRRTGNNVTLVVHGPTPTVADGTMMLFTPVLAIGWRFPVSWKYVVLATGTNYRRYFNISFRDTYQVGGAPPTNTTWDTGGGGIHTTVAWPVDATSWPTTPPA